MYVYMYVLFVNLYTLRLNIDFSNDVVIEVEHVIKKIFSFFIPFFLEKIKKKV